MVSMQVSDKNFADLTWSNCGFQNAILEERDYQEDGEVITGYISEKNKWRLEEFYD